MAVLLTLTACGDDDDGGEADTAAVEAVADFSCPTSATTPGAAGDGPRSGDRLKIVTTVAPITSIVANIAGDRADVEGVIPEGTNSHTYEPAPSVATAMASADILFINGLQLEDPTRELAETSLPKGSSIVELGTLTITEEQYLYDFSFPEDGGKPNPHLWTNPPMARCYAAIAAATLSSADPVNATTYQNNFARYAERLDELDRLMVEATATVPEDNRELLTYHDAYAYFAVRYGWRVIGAIQVSDFEEPTPKEVANLIEQVKEEDVPAIFGSEVFPSPVLDQIAAETGSAYVDDMRDDDLPGEPGEATHSYLGLMQFDFVTMVQAMGGNADALAAFDPADTAVDAAVYPQ